MEKFARTVLGYHGCRPDFAEALIRGDIAIADWKPSRNDWDWLGYGIYFWEFAPERARDWMAKGGVVGAIIQLGQCLDFTDTLATRLLKEQFEEVQRAFALAGNSLPRNQNKRADLDCLVINELVASAEASGGGFDTVRSPFIEGPPAFAGSSIRSHSHVQLAVRNPVCILGVFRPNMLA